MNNLHQCRLSPSRYPDSVKPYGTFLEPSYSLVSESKLKSKSDQIQRNEKIWNIVTYNLEHWAEHLKVFVPMSLDKINSLHPPRQFSWAFN